MTIEEFDQSKFVPKFSKNEEVEIAGARSEEGRALVGRKGVIRGTGIPEDEFDIPHISYAVNVDGIDDGWEFLEHHLVSTGRFREPTRFVGSIRVSQDGEMLSDGIMPPTDGDESDGR